MAHKYIRNQEIVTANIDDDLVMLDVDQGKYFSLNPVAVRVWELLENTPSKNELCTILMEEFEVDAVQCQSEVQVLLDEMIALKLISTSI